MAEEAIDAVVVALPTAGDDVRNGVLDMSDKAGVSIRIVPRMIRHEKKDRPTLVHPVDVITDAVVARAEGQFTAD